MGHGSIAPMADNRYVMVDRVGIHAAIAQSTPNPTPNPTPKPMSQVLKHIPQWVRSLLKSLILDLVQNDPTFAQQLRTALQAQPTTPTETGRSPLIGMISGPADLASRSQDILNADLKTH
jgi:hypothetical protein